MTESLISLNRHQLAYGEIACFHRPSLKLLKNLKKDHGITFVTSILSDNDNPQELESTCKKSGLKWTMVNISGISESLLKNQDVFERFRQGIFYAGYNLAMGESILIHCNGGVHRTGAFTYALLRYHGLDQEESLEILHHLRPEAYNCGLHRLEIAEKFSKMIQNESIAMSDIDLLGMNEKDYFNSKDDPLLWVKLGISQEYVNISMCITDTGLSKINLGISLYVDLKVLSTDFI